MKRGAKILKKNKDFSIFRSSNCGAKIAIRNLEKAKIIKVRDRRT